MWDRNKSLSLIDPVVDRGRLKDLLAACDIVITQRTTDEVFSTDELGQLLNGVPNPRRVVLVMPAYADWCPWPPGRESSQLVSAASGISLRQSWATLGPVDPVYQHILYIQGILARSGPARRARSTITGPRDFMRELRWTRSLMPKAYRRTRLAGPVV